MRRFPFGSWLIVCALGCLAWPADSRADDATGRTGVAITAGPMKLVGGEQDYSAVRPFVDLDVRHGFSPHWSLEAALKYGRLRPGKLNDDAGLSYHALARLYTVLWQPSLGLAWHPWPQRRISPFLGFSAGLTNWTVHTGTADGPIAAADGKSLKGHDVTAIVSGGLEVFASPRLSVTMGARYNAFPGNKLDDIGYSDPGYTGSAAQADANTALLETFLGLRLWFGDPDRDGDGIPDRLDKCPNDPEDFDGFQDTDGCPDLDNDRDGIPDRLDKCPNEAEDIDGFQDTDGCPDLDNDRDGVPDRLDKCPDAPEDIDGFQDDDGCPDPDNDVDGVLDIYDKCPDSPAGEPVSATGCPVVTAAPAPAPTVPPAQEIKDDLVLEGVNFFTGSANLTPASLEILKKVARSLQASPDVTIEIRGFTDDAGVAEANRQLSQRRAIAVREFLVQQGISGARMSAVGYGEDKPIGDNSRPEGRARNRRVEVHRTDR